MLLDSRALLMDRNTTANMLHVENGVTRISLILSERNQGKAIQSRLENAFPELEIFRWDQLYPALMQGKVMMDGFNMVTSIIVFTVASLGIFGVMMVSVLERLREFGIMMAIGTRYIHLAAIVLSESIILGIAGYLSGSLLGYLTLLYFKSYGLDLSVFSEGIETFGMDSISYATIHADYFITAGVAVLLATFSSIIVPLRILKKVRPMKVIQAM
jgi:ABC-type lipoprotein release transport system permease subunit